MTHHTSDDAMQMMAALEEAGVSKPTRFLSLLHERGYHVVRRDIEISIPQFLRRAAQTAETDVPNQQSASSIEQSANGATQKAGSEFFGKGADGAG